MRASRDDSLTRTQRASSDDRVEPLETADAKGEVAGAAGSWATRLNRFAEAFSVSAKYRAFIAQHALTLACLLGFVLLLRLATLRGCIGPDGPHKWEIARDLVAGYLRRPAQFDHHAARWAIVLPFALTQALLGAHAWVAFVPILGFDLLQAGLTYAIGVQLGSRAIGVVATVLFCLVPKMASSGSDLLPTVFESTYVLLTLCLLLWARLDSPNGRPRLALSLAAMCLAYLAKETTVFYLPGLVIGLWLLRRSLIECLYYCLGFLGFVALETLFYWARFGFAFGRFTIIKAHHLGNAKLAAPITSIGQLLERYLVLSGGFLQLFYAALLVTLSYPYWRRKLPADVGHRFTAIAAACWGFFLLNTFALKSLHPPRLAQPLNERYLLSALPLLALIVATPAVPLIRRGLTQLAKLYPRLAPERCALGLCAVCVGWIAIPQMRSVTTGPLFTTSRMERELRDAFDTGKPIVTREPKAHAITTARAIFLDRKRAKAMRCVDLSDRRSKATVCINGTSARYQRLSQQELRSRLLHWAKGSYADVTTLHGFHVTSR